MGRKRSKPKKVSENPVHLEADTERLTSQQW
jgi:hypothetical protein